MSRDIKFLADDLEKLLREQFKQDAPELGERVKATMQYNIVTEVYDKHEPTHYTRTYQLLQNVEVSNVEDKNNALSIDIYSDRKNSEGKDISYLVEHGDENDKGIKYDYPKVNKNPALYPYLNERPFMESTMKVMEDEIAKSLGKTLKQAIDKLNK